MKIRVNVKPGKKEDKIELNEGVYIVELSERAEKGKANIALIRLLAKHFKVPSSNIRILNGFTSHKKTLEIFS